MDTYPRSTYHHGNLRAALIAAARKLLDAGGVEAIGLRETARRVGVSATATYRHFADKDDLIAAVATEGFKEFGNALAAATGGKARLSEMGLAYVDFAIAHAGLFNLMFGPQLRQRDRFPELVAASDAAFALLVEGVRQSGGVEASHVEAAAYSAWSLAHGFARLALDELIPREQVAALARAILGPPGA